MQSVNSIYFNVWNYYFSLATTIDVKNLFKELSFLSLFIKLQNKISNQDTIQKGKNTQMRPCQFLIGKAKSITLIKLN